MDRPRFVIEASEAESMAKESGLSVLQLLPSLVKPAQNLARPPISKYHVGAVGLGSDGRIFLGVNLEFPGLPLHHSVHAEQFLVTNLAVHGEPSLRYIAVSATPCGHCRQFLQELRNAADIQILITSSENESEESTKFKPLSSILPNPFGPYDLLDEETPLLLEAHDNGLSILNKAIDSNCGNLCNGAALVAHIAGGGGGYERIVAGVLVEKEGAVVRQEDTARLLLKMVSPKCEFKVFLCHSASNGCKGTFILM
ncbi:hypothetical protein F0562_029927 [Nyssa sinensis]|uniref:cytidine deaminase n=1 Tax=Nyssa sinensis TaxID=561372 RepID=A0A5J5AZD0_9ASTE|nr:hypothetical protein F0562_029927 [Nyssa sinensis]